MSKTLVSIDFEKGRGFGSMGIGLPEDYLSGDRVTVLSTVAAIFLHPDPALANEFSQAVAMLALYGAGAAVKLSAEQYMQLETVAEEYQAIMRAPDHGNKSNENLADCVRRYAEQRFAHDTAGATTGLVSVDYRGWGNEGLIGSPEDMSFFDHLPGFDPARLAEVMPAVAPMLSSQRRQLQSADKRGELLTVAFLCTNPDKGLANPLTQAVSLLALYAAGAQIELTFDQFQELLGKATEFDFTATDMTQVAAFVCNCAAARYDGRPDAVK